MPLLNNLIKSFLILIIFKLFLTEPSAKILSSISKTSLYNSSGSLIFISNRFGLFWKPIFKISLNPLVITKAVFDPLFSRSALVPIVVPIFITSISSIFDFKSL